jgi:hypothetical protein
VLADVAVCCWALGAPLTPAAQHSTRQDTT